MQALTIIVFCVATLFAAGCGAKTAPAAAPSDATAPAQVTCALNCSGVEKTATGASEAEARAAAQALVAEVCEPDDGQYFITCLPATGQVP